MRLQEVSVLIVDDVNAIRIQIKELLKSFGFGPIHMASSGVEAQKVLQDENVNFVLADWHMSPMDGLELLKFVRSEPKYKEIPFVMITAENTRECVIKAVEHGVDEYLIKPMTMEQVQNKVFAVLTKRKVLL